MTLIQVTYEYDAGGDETEPQEETIGVKGKVAILAHKISSNSSLRA